MKMYATLALLLILPCNSLHGKGGIRSGFGRIWKKEPEPEPKPVKDVWPLSGPVTSSSITNWKSRSPQRWRPLDGNGPQEEYPEIKTKLLSMKTYHYDRWAGRTTPYYFMVADISLKMKTGNGIKKYILVNFRMPYEDDCREETPECTAPRYSRFRYKELSTKEVGAQGVEIGYSPDNGYNYVSNTYSITENPWSISIGERKRITHEQWESDFTASSPTLKITQYSVPIHEGEP